MEEPHAHEEHRLLAESRLSQFRIIDAEGVRPGEKQSFCIRNSFLKHWKSGFQSPEIFLSLNSTQGTLTIGTQTGFRSD